MSFAAALAHPVDNAHLAGCCEVSRCSEAWVAETVGGWKVCEKHRLMIARKAPDALAGPSSVGPAAHVEGGPTRVAGAMSSGAGAMSSGAGEVLLLVTKECVTDGDPTHSSPPLIPALMPVGAGISRGVEPEPAHFPRAG